MPTPNAARVGDGIKHSNALFGALTGLAVGLLVGAFVAATILTGGLAALALCAAISAVCTFAAGGYALGKLLGSLAGSKSGVIGEGAATVFIGAGLPPAARAYDKLACGDPPLTKVGWSLVGAVLMGPIGAIAGMAYGISTSEHAGAQIASGSKTVFIESRNAARIEDDTSCSGTIMEGSPTVGIGGEKVILIEQRYWRKEVPQWLEDTMVRVDQVGTILGFVSGAGALKTLLTRGWRAVPLQDLIELGFSSAGAGLYGLERAAAARYGENATITQAINWTRTGVGLAGGTYSGLSRAGSLRAPRTTTTTTPHVSTPDVPAVPPRPVPQGGQTIAERAAQGGRPPAYTQPNPNNYYYDPVAGRYKRR